MVTHEQLMCLSFVQLAALLERAGYVRSTYATSPLGESGFVSGRVYRCDLSFARGGQIKTVVGTGSDRVKALVSAVVTAGQQGLLCEVSP
jgi:hypothetical protein